MTTLGTLNGPQDFFLLDEMNSQPIETTPAAPAITSLLNEPLVSAWNQPEIFTHNPFSILGNDDPEGEFPPLNRVATSAPPPMERSVLAAFSVSATPRLCPPPLPGASNVAQTLTRPPWTTAAIMSLADVGLPCPWHLQQRRSAVNSPTLSIYGQINHAASWMRPLLQSTPQLLRR